ncbi:MULTISPECIES: helix-turn-helix domain-containing protein [Streptomyces]|uniref:Transcriptional regulator n=1 Tax=Streptomyces tsukubensis (strain DSM 42081 / NBRC 108919 / NRRL 18488 / 9993) TaxID=1114943 RepID=I2N2E7_STRT9|nr:MULTISPECIES: helix-turn-helix transcriptional regulator [Streptomyces]AZK95292.1 transcriptional regulator [Streptomyces tsukubensis]EIF91194.1 helix-turn-helix domain-containing protein [Streptomyces tsukubensis NRRL18488]MYS62963.1 helix-turn-helix domain-containing protein [Streptomyces sp. SID5473]QKM68652.1 transcriptional regulator [Streptomyces tsukubensis NRRL18488]TAI43458.1 XRE family transcriptional regulator [Streptomyces tsukubensis]
MAVEHLGDRLARLRRTAGLTQEGLAERAGVSADVVRKLEQRRKHSARLPTLHALAHGLGVELAGLLGDPPGVPSTGAADPPQLVAVRRAVMPPLFAVPREPEGAETLSLPLLRREIAAGWTLYHDAEFGRLMDVLPGIVNDAWFAASVGSAEDRARGQAALGKALQLAGHLAIRLGKTDLALSALERAMDAARDSGDPLLAPMISNSVAWNYQRQNRLDDAEHLAVHAADAAERAGGDTAEGVRVWGGLVMSAATSAARRGDYDTANRMMLDAETATRRLAALPSSDDGRMVSVFNRSSVRIERVRLAVQHARPAEALALAKGIRLSPGTPVSWRTWLLLDIARAQVDLGNPEGAVATLEKLHRIAPAWMRHHTLAVAIVNDLGAGPRHPPGLRRLAELLGPAI